MNTLETDQDLCRMASDYWTMKIRRDNLERDMDYLSKELRARMRIFGYESVFVPVDKYKVVRLERYTSRSQDRIDFTKIRKYLPEEHIAELTIPGKEFEALRVTEVK